MVSTQADLTAIYRESMLPAELNSHDVIEACPAMTTSQLEDFLEQANDTVFDLRYQHPLTKQSVVLAVMKSHPTSEKALRFFLDRGACVNSALPAKYGFPLSPMYYAVLSESPFTRMIVREYGGNPFTPEVVDLLVGRGDEQQHKDLQDAFHERKRAKMIDRIVNEPPSGDLKPMIVFPKRGR